MAFPGVMTSCQGGLLKGVPLYKAFGPYVKRRLLSDILYMIIFKKYLSDVHVII